MEHDIAALIRSSSNALKQFQTGSLPIEEARTRYLALLSECERVEQDFSAGEAPGHLEGICYHHNRENYAVLTAIYCLNGESLQPIAWHGAATVMDKLTLFLGENIDGLLKDDIASLRPDASTGIQHTIHLFRLCATCRGTVLLASLTASAYFREPAFLHTGSVARRLLFGDATSIHGFNHFESVSREIREYVQIHADAAYDPVVHLFVFPGIESTFMHMGVHSLFEASRGICDTIVSRFSDASRCFRHSLREYLIITSIRKKDPLPPETMKIDFSFRKIAIPFEYGRYRVTDEFTLQKFWSTAFPSHETPSQGARE